MDWRFSTFLLVLFALLAAFSVAPIEEVMCNSCYVKGVLKETGKDGALNCFEFWFNRYQTLLGVLVALGAGWLTWQGARGQVAAANQQRSVSLIGIVNDRREAVEEIARAIKGIDRLNNQMLGNINSIIAAIAELRAGGITPMRKQEIFDQDFEPVGTNYVQIAGTFSKRIATARENLKAAILAPSVRNEVEDYLAAARRIERRCKIVAATVKEAIDTKNWTDFDKFAFRIAVRAKESIHSQNFRDHPAQKSIDQTFKELSALLEKVLKDAHQSG